MDCGASRRHTCASALHDKYAGMKRCRLYPYVSQDTVVVVFFKYLHSTVGIPRRTIFIYIYQNT